MATIAARKPGAKKYTPFGQPFLALAPKYDSFLSDAVGVNIHTFVISEDFNFLSAFLFLFFLLLLPLFAFMRTI